MKKLVILTLILALLVGIFSRSTVEAKSLSAKQKKFIDSRISWAIELNDWLKANHGGKSLPLPAVIAQSALESGWGQEPFCVNRCNDFGIGGRDRPQSFSSHEESWNYYFRLMTNERYVTQGSLDFPDDYSAYLDALIAAGYCDDYGYKNQVLKITYSIEDYVKRAVDKHRATRIKKRIAKKNREIIKETANELIKVRVVSSNGETGKEVYVRRIDLFTAEVLR